MKRFRFAICLMILLGSAPAVPAQDQAPSRILILPFDINAPDEFAYLRQGIYDMLVSRLATVEQAEVIEEDAVQTALENRSAPLSVSDAIEVGNRLNAEYVVFGSFTMFGDSISTDATCYDLRQAATRVSFNQTGQSRGELIAHINRFSDRIKSTVFGMAVAAAPSPAPAPSAQPAPAAPEPATPTPQPAPVPAPTGVQSGLAPEPARQVPFALTQSRRLKTAIEGLAVADVNGDRINELVFIDKDRLYIYQFAEKRFKKIDEIKAGRTHRLVSVDAGDINANGVAEIFVTSALANTYGLNSFVLEWRQNGYQRIQDDSGWYFRVTRADGKPLLLGQQRADRAVFLNTKYELAWQNGEYQPARTLSLPDRLNIYGLAFGDILQDGKNEIVAFTANDRLTVLDDESRDIWTSSEPMGGSRTYLEAKDPEGGKMGEHQFKKRVYFSQRILIRDLDGNGVHEVIVVSNKDSAGRMLEQTRIFKKGVFECLTWDGSGLTPKWKTREFDGYISDYVIGDLDNDGADELVFALIQRKGFLMSTDQSTVYMMELR